jgi:cell division protein FtsL
MFRRLIRIIIITITIAILLAIGLGTYSIYGDVTYLQKETSHLNQRMDDKKLILDYSSLERRIVELENKLSESGRILSK